MTAVIFCHFVGPRSIFIKALLDKKYALPSTVICALVNYFAQFISYEVNSLPVLWHQTLLIFCQRYKGELDSSQIQTIVELTQIQHHDEISSEINRELSDVINSNMQL